MKKRQSPDFGSPEGGISALVSNFGVYGCAIFIDNDLESG